MNETVMNVVYVGLQISYGLVCGLFLHYMMPSRFRHPVFGVLILTVLWDIPFFCYYLTGSKEPYSVISMVLLITAALLIFKSSRASRLINIIFYFASIYSMDILAYFIAQTGVADRSSKLFAVVSLALSFALSSVILFSFGSIIKAKTKNNLTNISLTYLIIPASQIVLYYSCSYIFFNAYHQTAVWKNSLHSFALIVFVVLVFFSLGTDVWIFRQYIKNINAERIKAENAMLEERNRLNYQYFDELRTNELELKKIKHDLGGALEIVKELIYEETDMKQARQLFDELSQTVQGIDTGYYSKNCLLNAIITNKAKICKSEGIRFDVSVLTGEEIGVNDSDLCRALLNMLDNSIEANAAFDDSVPKYVSLSIRVIDDYLYIETQNPAVGTVIDKKTSKRDKAEHGYGLKILEQLAEENSGSFTITSEENSVTSLMTMRLNLK